MYNTGGVLGFATGATQRISVSAAGNATINAPSSGTTLLVNGQAGQFGLLVQAASGALSAIGITAAGAAAAQLQITGPGCSGVLEFNNTGGTDAFGIATGTFGLGVSNAIPVVIVTSAAERLRVGSLGNITINAPASGVSLEVNSFAGTQGIDINQTSGTAYLTFSLASVIKSYLGTGGLIAGASANDLCIRAGSAINFSVDNGASRSVIIGTNGAMAVATPSSGVAMTVNGLAGAFGSVHSLAVIAPNTASQSNGLRVVAGTNASDAQLALLNAASTITWLFLGDGSMNSNGLSSQGAGTINCAGLNVASNPVYAGIPQNLQVGATYTLVLSDANKHIAQGAGGAHTYTIPANASVAFPIGTAITIINSVGTGNLTLNITSDTLTWLPSGATGTRTLAAGASVTILKIAATIWYMTGVGIT